METRGRKPGPVELNERFTIRMNDREKQQLFTLAERNELSASELVTKLIRKELIKNKTQTATA